MLEKREEGRLLLHSDFKRSKIKMNKIIETIEEVHNKDICMFKVGNFYHIYNKDAEIFKYKKVTAIYYDECYRWSGWSN